MTLVSGSYREHQPLVRPAFHGGPTGEAWAQSLGVLKDSIELLARQARRQRWLSLCAEDALARHGQFRGWSRVSGETVAQYRTRLRAWWQLALWQGTAKGIIDAFALLGMSNVEVREAISAYVSGGSPWGRYTGVGRQRQFAVVVRQPHPFGTDGTFIVGTSLVGTGVLGMTGDPSLIKAVREIVRRMRPAHAYCPEIIVVLAGDITDGTGTTADGDPSGAPGDRIAYLKP